MTIRRAFAPVLLAAAVLASPLAVTRPQACPVYIPPQPLRTLYKLSERVVVARVGVKEVLSREDEVASVRLALHVTENLKGPPAEVLHLYQTEFMENEAEAARKDEAEGELEVAYISSAGRRVPRLKRGERYLFFLDPREKGDGYEVDNEGYGIKQLSDEDLKVYVERIKELTDILRREPEDKAAVLEWLVRCAEHPATRWDGSYELLASAEAAARADDEEAEAQAEAELKPEPGEGPPIVVPISSLPLAAQAQAAPEQQVAAAAPAVPAVAPAPQVEEVEVQPRPAFSHPREIPPDPALAPMLNAVQKQRLADSFFATPDPVLGDDELLQIVKDFGDPRFDGFVLARLRRVEDAAPMEAELWLRTLAASLKNERLIALADTYAQEAPYFEEDEEETAEGTAEAESESEAQAEASAEASAASDDEGEEAEEVEETPEDPEAEAARIKAATERATRKRSAMLRDLLSRIDLFISTGQLASN